MKTKVMTKKVPKTGVEQIEGNGRSYPYLYSIGDLVQGSLNEVCTDRGNELKVN